MRLEPWQTLEGDLFNEPMRVETATAEGPDSWTVGLSGLRSEKFRKVRLARQQLYPRGSEERRLVEAMLLAMPR